MRLWGQLRKRVAQEWEDSHRLMAHVGERSRTCTIVFTMHAIKAEAAKHKGLVSAGAWLDLSKAYERIRHIHVLTQARAFGFSLSLWRCACRLYAGPRAIQWRTQITSMRSVNGSALPGCTLAVIIMKLAIHMLLIDIADMGHT
eukprot:860905-Amphidinium_carterae.1